MKKPTDTAIIESLLRVYEKPDDESLLIPRPALFNELGVFSQPLILYLYLKGIITDLGLPPLPVMLAVHNHENKGGNDTSAGHQHTDEEDNLVGRNRVVLVDDHSV